MRQATYSSAGVDRETRAKAKKFGFNAPVALRTPFNDLFELNEDEYYLVTADGVGTKALLAYLAEKFDSIGVDAVAMVVNDAVRCGAKPEALVDMLDVSKSEPALLKALCDGIASAAREAGCFVAGGETADVPELVTGLSLNAACFARVAKNRVVVGDSLCGGDVLIGLRSSGLHSNGLTLARKLLFKEWGGVFDAFDEPEEIGRELVFEALEPTRIYVKPVLEAMRSFDVKAGVHVTGDAYLKFSKLFAFSKKGVGFEFDNFSPQPVFALMRGAAEKKGLVLGLEEMFKTFNMGWGFVLALPQEQAGDALQLLGKTVESEVIGRVTTEQGRIRILFEGTEMVLAGG